MNKGVTVWANRSQVSDWIHLIGGSNARYGNKVMDVDESLSFRAIGFAKIKVTDYTNGPMSGEASLPSDRIAFVRVYRDSPKGTLDQFCRVNFFWQCDSRDGKASRNQPNNDFLP